MENPNGDDSVIPSSPATMEENPRDGFVIPSIPPTLEDPKDDSVIPSTSPTMEDPKEEGVIAKTADLSIDDTKSKTPDDPTNDDSVPPSIPLTNGDSVTNTTHNTTPHDTGSKDNSNPTPDPNPSPSINTTDPAEKNISFSILEKFNRGVIVDVLNVREARIAEYAGVKAVNVTIDTHSPTPLGMADPSLIKKIKDAVKIPVMAKVRIGHYTEAKMLESFGIVDYIDESESLPKADVYFIKKHEFDVPFVCGCKSLGEALYRMTEGAALIRIHGHPGILETVVNVKAVMQTLRFVKNMRDDEVYVCAKRIRAPCGLLSKIKELDRFPVPLFAGGSIHTPGDAVLMMCLGCDGVFLSNEVFRRPNTGLRLHEIVKAVEHFDNPHLLGEFVQE